MPNLEREFTFFLMVIVPVLLVFVFDVRFILGLEKTGSLSPPVGSKEYVFCVFSGFFVAPVNTFVVEYFFIVQLFSIERCTARV
jgi:hypothetical protein